MASRNMTTLACSVEGCARQSEKRGMCGMHYQRVWKYGDPAADHRPPPNIGRCVVDWCGNPPRSNASPHCEAHYYRLRRRGSLELKAPKPVLEHSGGYLLDRFPNHPLAAGGKYVYQHRAVFYAAHGNGPFVCHVCNASVGWATMHIDHLDDNPKNNALSNLAPACPTCNTKRAAPQMRAAMKARRVNLTAFGRERSLSDWAADLGITKVSLLWRLQHGWTPERAVTEPRGKTGPRG